MRKLLRLLTCFSLFIVSIDAFAQQNVNITVNPQTSKPEQKSRPGIAFLYNYLKVITNELGYFETEPTSTINRINKEEQYGYNTWRLPSDEELSMLRANGYAKEDKTYMTQSRRYNGHVILVTDKEKASVIRENEKKLQEARRREAEAKKQEQEWQAQRAKTRRDNQLRDSLNSLDGWCDLGLPSGTLWLRRNDVAEYLWWRAHFTWGEQLPTREQWEELHKYCSVRYIEKGYYMITGPNGNAMTLRPSGYWVGDKDEFGNIYYTEINDSKYYIKRLEKRHIDYWTLYITQTCKKGEEDIVPTMEGAVDLGLPSGTKWDVRGWDKPFSWDPRVYEDEMPFIPRKSQWEELKTYCKWEKKEDGYIVTGPNGHHICLYAPKGKSYYCCRDNQYGSTKLYRVKLSDGNIKLSFSSLNKKNTVQLRLIQK